ncbi:hypothetical protein CCACVL1_25531 [Corchorus capsularis]|uniref:Peptidase S28 n=1 Tax=Corchorus capsularis TaxID=210143 RepID=A0A1R3GJE7_COCAP|nr:hypothetical protein CCACVL1_25531 [Corchorus capsularis]
MENLKPNNSEGLTQSKSELPQEFIKVMEDMGGFDAKFVIQKRLSVADTNLPPCCLSIPLKAVKRDFLTEQEEEFIDEYEIPVLCIDPSLNVREMALSRDFTEEEFSIDNNQKNSQTAYKFTQNWHSVKERNGLKTGDLVKIWTFLIQDDDEDGLKRGFALVKVEDGQPRPPKKKPDRELKLKDDNHQKPKSKKEPKKIRPRKRYDVVERSMVTKTDIDLPPEFVTYYYNQTLDHFNYKYESYLTFQQQYVVNSKYWGGANSSSPIFVYTGDEARLYGDVISTSGFMIDLASRFQALILYIEIEGQNASTLGFFSSSQALADYAQLIIDLKRNLSATNCPVIAVGGSYGGMLASWFRLKYPHIAIGALASSAPILYFDDITPQNGYHVAATRDFRETSENCYNTIRQSWFEIDKVALQQNGLMELSNIFNSCMPLYSSEELKNYLSSVFLFSAQYGNPPYDFVSHICNAIDEAPEGTDILGKVAIGLNASFFGGRVLQNISDSIVAVYTKEASFPIPRTMRYDVVERSQTDIDLPPEFVTYYYEQTLDHFNYKSESYLTFRQKYIVNSKYWGGANSSSPIFVYTGGADELFIDIDVVTSGFMTDLASRFQGLLLYIEHRYYGDSMPFGYKEIEGQNASTLGFLSSSQALADYAQLIIDLKGNLSAKDCPVIAIGGFYGGMLASWFRLKYPHIAIGALA